jgi:hypothetical protein
MFFTIAGSGKVLVPPLSPPDPKTFEGKGVQMPEILLFYDVLGHPWSIKGKRSLHGCSSQKQNSERALHAGKENTPQCDNPSAGNLLHSS